VNRFDSIFFGGTGFNLLWSFGASKKLYELNFRNNIQKVGSISAGCMSALAFLDAANYEIGIVQSEQLHKEKFFLSTEFRIRFRYYFEAFANVDPLNDIKNSGCDFYPFYGCLNSFPEIEIKTRNDFKDRDDLLTTCLAGCYIPFLFGIEPNLIKLPILSNGDLAVDAGIKTISTYRWDEKTLLVSPNEKMSENTIGGNLNILNTLGIRNKKLTDKELFLKGYMDASRWYAEYYLHEKSWRNQKHWYQKMQDYDLFKKTY
jgi:hypothetical protein